MQTVMTFEEILQEGVDDSGSSNPPDVVSPAITNSNNNNTSSNSNNGKSNNINSNNGQHTPLGQIPEPTEPSVYESLKKAQKRVLCEALYHSAENGYVDITIDLRNMGEWVFWVSISGFLFFSFLLL